LVRNAAELVQRGGVFGTLDVSLVVLVILLLGALPQPGWW
jgi:hypothetical protein